MNFSTRYLEEGEHLMTLKDERYCCPFCSNGETIEFRKRYNTASEKEIYYLICDEGCFTYNVGKIDRIAFLFKGWEFREKRMKVKARQYFKKFIEYNEGKEDFLTAR